MNPRPGARPEGGPGKPMGPILPPPMMDTRHIARKWLDLPYAQQSPAQKLDIYLPESDAGPFPVIVGIAIQSGSAGSADRSRSAGYEFWRSPASTVAPYM